MYWKYKNKTLTEVHLYLYNAKTENGKFDAEILKRIIPAVTEGTPM